VPHRRAGAAAGRAPEADRTHVIAALNTHIGGTVTALSLGPQR